MSHLQELSRLKNDCDSVGQCTEYKLFLQQQQQDADNYTTQANQTAIAWGLAIGIIGLFILLTPFNKLVKRIQKFLIPSLAIIAPILIGLAAGAYIGFFISFSACFVGPCSSTESSALYTLPLLSLLFTIPLAVLIYKKRLLIAKNVNQAKPIVWIVIGALIILFVGMSTYSTIVHNTKQNELRKAALTETS